MYKILTAAVLSTSLLLASCGDSLDKMKAKLADLKSKQNDLNGQIDSLQTQIEKKDSTFVVKAKAKLVSINTLAPTSFTHYIDLQGNVVAENTSMISPRGTGGLVRAVYVKKGDPIHQGQLLLKLDDAIQRQQLNTAQTQLSYAKDIYQRRKNLWDQKIGAEVDLINAQNQVDMAQNQVKLAQEQLDFTNVNADISGVVDDITIKPGETFAPGSQQLSLINTNNLKVVVQVPEIYQERVRVGTPVRIVFPGLGNKIITGTVHITGKAINTGSRSFAVEIRIPNDASIRANQVAIVKLQDYNATSVITIPVNTLQTDEKGKYVMIDSTVDKKNLAHKRSIVIGQLYEDKIEVTSGLQPGDKVITDGFQGLYEGQLITTQ